MSWGYGYEYREYVPVAQRKAQARKFAAARAKKQKRKTQPVMIEGQKIAKTFWGKAWCDHLESYSDYANRLPRGRTYARNGSVVDLQISSGRLEAIVGGSDVYEITVDIDQLKPAKWKEIRNDCAASIDSLLDLLGGRLSDGVMQRLTSRPAGLFPAPEEINMQCDCPDWAGLCKHLAAVLYGVGAHLDKHPELLFLLRGVDHTELVSEAVSEGNLSSAFGEPSSDLAGEDLGAIFGIEIDTTTELSSKKKPAARKRKSTAKKVAGKKSDTKTKVKRGVKKAAAKKGVKKTAATKKVKSESVENPPTRKKPAKIKKAAVKPSAKKKPGRKKKAATTEVATRRSATGRKSAAKKSAKKKVGKKAR
ncbi:MAG: hypothetical protein GY903_10745 [Fuerstiella sp.]|nr:hypothetical protein [Fuerstiella sp.]MCP4854957.1 hypothetical protein [Fuerstiella sp.]